MARSPKHLDPKGWHLMSTTTITEKDVHVTCSEFCGLPISETGEAGKAQHAEDCGATEADLAKLDRDLGVARIHAAKNSDEAEATELDSAIPPDDAPPAKFRCSCGDSFPDWPELGDHQTATRHVGMWTEPSDAIDDDALDEREDATTVDGAAAKIKHDRKPKGEKIERVDRTFPPIALVPGALEALQRSFDKGDFSGEKQLKETCDYEDTVHGVCTHIATFVKVIKTKCEACGHSHKEVTEKRCIGHGINTWGANEPSRLQTSLL